MLDLLAARRQALGGDAEVLKSCTADQTYKSAVEEDVREGTDANITGTPTFFVIAEGVKPRAATFQELSALLVSEPYKSLIDGGKNK